MIIARSFSIAAACCWMPTLTIVLKYIYIFKIVSEVFSSNFFKNKFPEMKYRVYVFLSMQVFIL